jgi:glycosyltransferase involved in cell wall biosynthesis
MAQLNGTLEHVRRVRVAFVGQSAHDELPNGFERVSADVEADVYHVHCDQLAAVHELRARHANAAVVLDLTAVSVDQLDRSALRLAREADVIAVDSARAARTLEERDGRLAGRAVVMPASIDLGRFAPDAELAATRRVHYSRFKRYHRLAPPTILFAGAYAPDGGLALALDAVYRLRESVEDIRFTAIPFGRVDRRHLDRCERRALLLGHRGIVEWTAPPEDELPFWFATASVVLVAGDDASRPALLAAAAAHPVVALDAASIGIVNAGQAIPDTAEALAAAISGLLGPVGIAAGEESRRELVAGQAAARERLAQLWSSAAFAADGLVNASFRAVRAEAASAPSSSTLIQPR